MLYSCSCGTIIKRTFLSNALLPTTLPTTKHKHSAVLHLKRKCSLADCAGWQQTTEWVPYSLLSHFIGPPATALVQLEIPSRKRNTKKSIPYAAESRRRHLPFPPSNDETVNTVGFRPWTSWSHYITIFVAPITMAESKAEATKSYREPLWATWLTKDGPSPW